MIAAFVVGVVLVTAGGYALLADDVRRGVGILVDRWRRRP